MENKILEIIKLHTGNLHRNKQTDLSLENEQLKLAHEIVKLFAIPVVRHIVCPDCGCNKLQHEGNNQYLCLSVICDFHGQIMP